MKLPANAGGTRDTGLIPGLGRSPGGGQLAPVFLPEESPGQRSLEGYSPRGHQESDTTERLSTHTGISMSETNWVVYIWTSIPHEGRSTDMNFQGSYFFPSLSSGWQIDFLMTYWAIYFFSLYFSWDWGPSRVLHGGLSCGALVAHGFRTLTSAPTLPSPAPQPGGPQWWALPCSPSSASALSARALCSLPWHSCDFGPVPLRVPVSVVGTEHSTCHWASQPISRPLSQMTFMMNRKDIQSLGSVIDQNKAPQSLEAPSHPDRRGGWVVSQATDSPSGPGAACPHCGEQAP